MRGGLGLPGLIRLAVLAVLGVVMLGGCAATTTSVHNPAQGQTRTMG